MGIYDTYGETQLKVGDPQLRDFKLGDTVDIPDGVYMAPEGVVVIIDSKFVAEFAAVVDKWGDEIGGEVDG